MSGDDSVIADTVKNARSVCRVGGDAERKRRGRTDKTNVVRGRRWRLVGWCCAQEDSFGEVECFRPDR